MQSFLRLALLLILPPLCSPLAPPPSPLSRLSTLPLPSSVLPLSSPLPPPTVRAVFESIEVLTRSAAPPSLAPRTMDDPSGGDAREQMAGAYAALSELGHVPLFGAALAAPGTWAPKRLSQEGLEAAKLRGLGLDIEALTPKKAASPDLQLFAGIALAVAETYYSLTYHVPLPFLFVGTLLLLLAEKLLLNGVLSEQLVRATTPDYDRRVARHEAGHFLVSYLLGCPIEGVVLSALSAMADKRFGGIASTI
ncbi:hypothetical protein TeGR_g13497, partial [Tetraparma gracilis]